MKRLYKGLIILFIIFSIQTVNAKFTTKNNLINTLQTINFNIKLNASGGTFNNSDLILNNNLLTLPIPQRIGYLFNGYKCNNETYNTTVNIYEVNNKELSANWIIREYTISYNLDGGTLRNRKTRYNVEEEFTIGNPTKAGFTFLGWTGSNGDTPTKNLKIKKGTTGNLNFKANWARNYALVTIIPRIDNIDYEDGYSDYTFSVYINDNLIDNNLSVWSNEVKVGNRVRVVTNQLAGRTTNYDETITIEDINKVYLYPTWTINSYKSEFYFQSNYITYTLNKYGNRVETPNITAGDLGYNNYWYVINSYTPLDSWIQQDRTMRFNINVDERECSASFGSATRENAIAQLNIINGLGYNFCSLTDWNSVECTNKYQNTINLYNIIWNYLPYSGNGYSIYKQIYCDSGWSMNERR